MDDDQPTRTLMRMTLEDAGYQVFELDRGERIIETARRLHPSLVIIDVRLPGDSGYEVCRKLREIYGNDLPIMFVSGERTEALDRVSGLLLGADDYVVKPFATDELVARVRVLMRRATSAFGALSRVLSVRELEVLRMLTDGLGLKQIAERLVISPKTVSTHIEHIFLKLGVQTRAQAVALAYRQGLAGSASSAPSAWETDEVLAQEADALQRRAALTPIDGLSSTRKGNTEIA